MNKTPVDLYRTFSKDHLEQEDWQYYFNSAQLTWQDLLQQPLVVILGQAGIGKTTEMRQQVTRLKQNGDAAFFVALNMLDSTESWQMALTFDFSDYEQWKQTDKIGYFFLDAVDEAMLNNLVSFTKSLNFVYQALKEYLSRVCIVISSRPPDWSIYEVQARVEQYLVKPIASAKAKLEPNNKTDNKLDAYVVKITQLAIPEAKKLASYYGLQNSDVFWLAVTDGSYESMACHPLDLQGLVGLWNQQNKLGTYLELMRFMVDNRLTEVNQLHLDTSTALSEQKRKDGAQALAAACEFSGKAYIATNTEQNLNTNQFQPSSVLDDWQPKEIKQLLNSAIFDHATFGRAQFHHRTLRAFLAAQWLEKQMKKDMGFNCVKKLFAKTPFDDDNKVLIHNRRWVLCWLASLHLETREWLAQDFPEMLVFDGDPEAWEEILANQAFKAYILRLDQGLLYQDWFNDTSELVRVGRRLTPGLLAQQLTQTHLLPKTIQTLLLLAERNRARDCAIAVFDIYQDPALKMLQADALDTLQAIATPEQRNRIKQDLITGLLNTNELIASALSVIDLSELGIDDLVTIFNRTQKENGYGANTITWAIKQDILPNATQESTQLLLSAILEALKQSNDKNTNTEDTEVDFIAHLDAHPLKRQWLLNVLPNCFERLLQLLPNYDTAYIDDCTKAALIIEQFRHSDLITNQERTRIQSLIWEHTKLRFNIALALLQSKNNIDAALRLTSAIGNYSCLVHFTVDDLPILIIHANDNTLNLELREQWFIICRELAWQLNVLERKNTLRKLKSSIDVDRRNTSIFQRYHEFRLFNKQSRVYKLDRQRNHFAKTIDQEKDKAQIIADVENIRTSQNHYAINYLIHYCNRDKIGYIDYQAIEQEFGKEVAEALAIGLKNIWETVQPPNPLDYPNGNIPYIVFLGLVGFQTLLDTGKQSSDLTGDEVSRATKLAVWELNEPPKWFESLLNCHSDIVINTLSPWIIAEAKLPNDAHLYHGGLYLALRCSNNVASKLLKPLLPLIHDNSIVNHETLKKLLKIFRAENQIDNNCFIKICREQVMQSVNTDGLIERMDWLRLWFEEDPNSAWLWFNQHLTKHPANTEKQITVFAKMAIDCRWQKMLTIAPTHTEPTVIKILQELYVLLTKYQPSPNVLVDDEDKAYFNHAIPELLNNIPNILSQVAGIKAHQALVNIRDIQTEQDSITHLQSLITRQAILTAEQDGHIEPKNLNALVKPYIIDPKTEAELYTQVLGRLEDINLNITEGPFSERSLFSASTSEKQLQLWLAARFLETQNRRFTVTREEEVDDDKKTDIQINCHSNKVCIEIKPLSKKHAYSASKLTETLEIQMGQYLKGVNSSHGILVLFRLETKNWEIPERSGYQPFSVLVEYLQQQANSIKNKYPHVQALQVFGIDCVSPENKDE